MELEAGTVGVAGGLGMLPTARAWAQVGTSWPSWARAHAPRARLGSRRRAPYRKPAGSALVAEGGGGGNAPVTSGSRGSGREGRGGGGETTADWCARIIHTTQWFASSRPARAPSGSHPQLAATQRSRLYSGGTSPWLYTWGAPGGAVGAAESRLQPEEGARGKVMNSIISHSPPTR